MLAESVKPLPRRRQSRRQPQRVYSVGDTICMSTTYPRGSHTITARIERISVKASTIPGQTITTYVVAAPGRSIVMSSAEFAARIVEAN